MNKTFAVKHFQSCVGVERVAPIEQPNVLISCNDNNKKTES